MELLIHYLTHGVLQKVSTENYKHIKPNFCILIFLASNKTIVLKSDIIVFIENWQKKKLLFRSYTSLNYQDCQIIKTEVIDFAQFTDSLKTPLRFIKNVY